MAQQTPPYVISAATHSAALFRQANDAPFMRRGVVGPGEYAVAQQSTPNMSVQVGAGRVVVPGTQGVTPSGFGWSTQGSYFAENDASATVTIAASNPTNPRIDVVYVAVQDAFYSGSSNQVVLGVATGTPAASPTVPAIPANAVGLAQVAVGANVSSIVTANIANLANLPTAIAMCLGGILTVTGSTQYPTNPYVGQYIDDANLGLLRWNGTAWAPGKIRAQFVQTSSTTGIAGSYKILAALSASPSNGGVLNFPGIGNSGGVITIPVGFGGQYKLSGQVTLTTVTGMTGIAGAIYQNGTIIHGVESLSTGGTTPALQTVSLAPREFTLADNDTLSLEAFSFGGTTSSYVDANRNYNSWINIERVTQ